MRSRFGSTFLSYLMGFWCFGYWLMFFVGASIVSVLSMSIALGYLDDNSLTLTGTAIVFDATIAGLTMAYATIVTDDDKPLGKKFKLSVACDFLTLSVVVLIISAISKYASMRILAIMTSSTSDFILSLVTAIQLTAHFGLLFGTTNALCGAGFLFAAVIPPSQINPRYRLNLAAEQARWVKESLNDYDTHVRELEAMKDEYEKMELGVLDDLTRSKLEKNHSQVVQQLAKMNRSRADLKKWLHQLDGK